MVKLQENKTQKAVSPRGKDLDVNTPLARKTLTPQNTQTTAINTEGGELEKFSQSVLKQMIDENIPPTPTNFAIYFDKLLAPKPLLFKKELMNF